MKLYLIRHAQSIQNTKENYGIGLPDHKVYLSNEGIKQAKNVGLFLKTYTDENNVNLDNAILWVSPFKRTRQTAKLLNTYLNIKKVKEDYALIEQRYGLFSDKEIQLIKEMYPDEFKFYDNYYQNDGKFYARLPQGESPFDVALRTRMFLETINRDNYDNIFVVSHGTTIRTIIMNWFHYSPEWFNAKPNIDNCSVILIDNEKYPNKEEYIYGGPVKKLTK